MDSRIATELLMATQPVALLFADEKPVGAKEFAPGKWGCVIALVSAASKGHVAAISRETCGCMGGRIGLGWTGCGHCRGPQ